LQQAAGKHRPDDRVLGVVPGQRCEFAVKVAGDVHRAGPRRQLGGGGLGCAGGTGAAPGVGRAKRAGQDQAGQALAGHHARRALACHQAELAEEVTRLHLAPVDHLAVGTLQQAIGGPVEDQVQRIGGLTLFDHAGAGRKPLYSHVVPGQPHSGRLAGEQGDRL
jgi:hypothetical protein